MDEPSDNQVHRNSRRADLYDGLEQAFVDARVPWHRCYREDREDGVMLLVPADVPKSVLVESLFFSLIKEVRRHNASRPTEGRLRLRLALHDGEIARDAHGVTGTALNACFRLLEAPALKGALARSPGVLAVITSARFYDEVVRHCPAGEPGSYHEVDVAVKETRTTGWICLPDHPYGEPQLADPPRSEPAARGMNARLNWRRRRGGDSYVNAVALMSRPALVADALAARRSTRVVGPDAEPAPSQRLTADRVTVALGNAALRATRAAEKTSSRSERQLVTGLVVLSVLVLLLWLTIW
jgi:hypothetical protein